MGLRNTFVWLLATAVPLGLGHPGGERIEAHAAQPLIRKSLRHCNSVLNHPEFVKRSVDRRMAEVERLQKARGLETKSIDKRTIAEVLAKDHRVYQDYDETTPASDLFKDAGACMLSPEVTEGPLYVRGQDIRREVTEGESGVKMTIDIQVVDVRTCQPIVDAAVDFWSCNATGVYGGVLNYPGNGNPNDLSLINTTTLRGVQFTDDEGIASFDTVVPGHYAGRTNHVHAMAHLGATRLPNNTITGGRVAHVGQMYFDQTLLNAVERVPPYAGNNQQWTQNNVDALMATASNGDDPVVRYVYVGDDVADGIYAWIRFGVDSTASRPYNPAAYIDESGGHQTQGGFGTGFGGGFGGGGFPAPGQGGGFGGFGFGKNKARDSEASKELVEEEEDA